ncbi:pyridoxine 5'-phosphate synthase [Candidatus Endomicrobiellum agilis]|uniref:pyridoxine 5'-phosphate synthase n=1 Tax=Candidatus Endomicrobiellum agilis TaxID=3238957 RepID=UPI00358131D3|nr:pyridoxine 5'-phosphate synthase [Endomicrobium sp.]
MIKLGVNIDHIATIRQARKEDFPSLIKAALICEKSGADSITVHLREDRRHIQDRDVYELRKSLKTKLNLEMAASEEIVEIALDIKPDFVCMVPEKRRELTTEGGLDVKTHKSKLASIVARLKKVGIIVSMFIDADTEQVLSCSEVNADMIELHTGKYAKFFKENGIASAEFKEEMEKISEASREAIQKGLILNAGHGLDYDNIERICKVPGMNEFNIGFSIIAESVFTGLGTAVKNMKGLIGKG